MNLTQLTAACCLGLTLFVGAATAGPLDPNCTPEKAAKSVAAKSTVGIGGRCDAKDAAKDSSKKALGVEDKGPLEKKKSKSDTPVEKARDAVTK